MQLKTPIRKQQQRKYLVLIIMLLIILNHIVIVSSYNQQMMKSICLILALLISFTLAIPYKQQLALVNSLQVGRQEDPTDWTCVGCDQTNEPIHSFVIEEKAVEIRAIISVYEEYTVLAFRYTANAKNIWQDVLWAIQVQDEGAPKGCKVQREYDNMWASIRSDVIQALRQHVHTRRLIITGISLGGGLATISFVDIRASGQFQNIQVITFGAPRVGNKKWAAWFDTITKSTRIYIREDPVAFLPRCLTLLCNYGQTGNPIVCYPQSNRCVCKGDDDDNEPKKQQILNYWLKEITEHKEQIAVGQLGGVIDHIYGYKKVKDYTLQC